MKFAVISFIFIGFIYQKVQIFLLRCIFSSHVHTLLSSMSCFFMLLSFYTQIYLVTPFLICNYPLFFPHSLLTFPLLCPPLILSSFFPLFNLLPSILQSLRVSHFSIILLFWTVYPYSLPLFVCSLFLLSFILWPMCNSGITFCFRWRISLTIIGWLVWMRKASRSGKRPSPFFSFTIQCF